MMEEKSLQHFNAETDASLKKYEYDKIENLNSINKIYGQKGNYGSMEDIPPPTFCSTPKSKTTGMEKNLRLKKTLHFEMSSPIATWLDELRESYFPECTISLQSKSLSSDTCSKVKHLTVVTNKVIQTLHEQTYLIANEFDRVYRNLEKYHVSNVKDIVETLINHMLEVLNQHSKSENDLTKYQNVLKESSYLKHPENLSNLLWKINALALDFSKRIDQLLLDQIKILVSVIEYEESPACLAILINGLICCGLQAEHIGNLLARCTGVEILVDVLKNFKSLTVRTATLRLLATICCTPNSLSKFYNRHGLEIVTFILSNEAIDETEQKEAVSLIAQVTGPWARFHNLEALPKLIVPLISTLSSLTEKTKNSEMLLLCSAALANISHHDDSILVLVDNLTVPKLLTAIRKRGPNASIFLKEQAATIILNMSNHPHVLCHLCQNRVVPALICFLQNELNNSSSAIEAASYRVQHKAALALARLCNKQEAVNQVQQLQGISRLVKVCKAGLLRDQNDGIFIASLEALKKIMTSRVHHPSHDKFKFFENNILKSC